MTTPQPTVRQDRTINLVDLLWAPVKEVLEQKKIKARTFYAPAFVHKD